MKRMSRMNGTLTAALAIALTAGAASAQCRVSESKGELSECEQPKGELTGSFASPLKASMTEALGGGSFADLQPEGKQGATRHKVYVKVVGPDGEVREWTVGGEDGPHAIHMHGQDGHGSKPGPDGKTRVFRVRPGDFDFDFEWDADWDFEGLEDLKALDAEEIERKVRSHVGKMHRHLHNGMRVFGGEGFAFDFEGVPSAEEIEKLVEKAMDGVELHWEGGDFEFDGEFDFDLEGMHGHLRHLDEHLQEMKKHLHRHLHQGGHQGEQEGGRVRWKAPAVAIGWAPARMDGDQPEVATLRKRGGQDDGTTYNIVIKKQDGGESYVVEIDDGKATAKVNGKKVPEERVKLGGGKVVILGEDGEEMAAFPVMIAPGGAWATTSPGGWSTWSQDGPSVFQFDSDEFEGAGAFSFAGPSSPPPVMLGVTMASPGESVAQHFDLEEGEGIEIQSVIEGLPAAEAGLRAKDIIVEVEGAEKATPDALRALLREKQPGDEITVKVLRQGDVEERVIELREYDAEKLGAAITVSPEGHFWHDRGGRHWTGQTPPQFSPQFPPQFWGEFEKSLKGSLEPHMSEHQIDEAKKAFEEAMKHLRSAPGRLRIAPQEDGQWLYLQGEDGQEREFFAVPRGRGGDELDKQISGLKEELAEVRRQRDEMAGELREIKALLKKLADDRQ